MQDHIETWERMAPEVLAGLQRFDAQHKPFGLYTLDPEFNSPRCDFVGTSIRLAIIPAMEAVGCVPDLYDRYSQQCTFFVSDGVPARLRLLRTSIIKVREFGNAYKVDKSVDASRYWQSLDLENEVRRLHRPVHRERNAKDSVPDWDMLMFIGFDKSATPFRTEMNWLPEILGKNGELTRFHERVWADEQNRGFYVRCGLWARLNLT